MIVYKDRSFCQRDCGRDECIRNKKHIPWENTLPVCFIRGDDCDGYLTPRNKNVMADYYIKNDDTI